MSIPEAPVRMILKCSNVHLAPHQGSWVNWKQRPNRVEREINRRFGARSGDEATGKY